MESKRASIIMSILFGITQIVSIMLGLIMKRNMGASLNSLIYFAIISVIGVSLLGTFFGFLYSKISKKIPFDNLYMKTSTYLIILNVVLFVSFVLPKSGIQLNSLIDLAISIITGIGGGCLFSWMYNKSLQKDLKRSEP